MMLSKGEFMFRFRAALDNARKQFEAMLYVSPVALITSDDGMIVFSLAGAPDTTAEATAIRMIASKFRACAIIYITEAWVAEGLTKEELGSVPISERPDSVEIVMAIGECRLDTGKTLKMLAKAPIQRGDGVTLGQFEVNEAGNMEGRVTNFLRQSSMNPAEVLSSFVEDVELPELFRKSKDRNVC